MQPQTNADYQKLITEVIKKQIVILGPDITLAKARNVPGLTVADDGTVTAMSGSPTEITQALIDQFVQLSGLIVKKTMEPLLLINTPNQTPGSEVTQPLAEAAPTPQITPNPITMPVQVPTGPVETVTTPVSPTPPQAQPPQPVVPIAPEAPSAPVPQVAQPVAIPSVEATPQMTQPSIQPPPPLTPVVQAQPEPPKPGAEITQPLAETALTATGGMAQGETVTSDQTKVEPVATGETQLQPAPTGQTQLEPAKNPLAA